MMNEFHCKIHNEIHSCWQASSFNKVQEVDTFNKKLNIVTVNKLRDISLVHMYKFSAMTFSFS